MDNFRNEAFDGKKWPARKGKQKGAQRSLLVKSGHLIKGNRVIPLPNGVRYVNDTDYARIHNYGGLIQRKGGNRILAFKQYKRGKFKGRTLFSRNDEKASYGQRATIKPYAINMPQRQFIGRSPLLVAKAREALMKHMKGLNV